MQEYVSSDSSMVDEYLNKISWHNIIIPRSDSSMVDEYARTIHGWHLGQKVQIPLWSMNTEVSRGAERVMMSSDSSMVDEYIGNNVFKIKYVAFRFLYGR